MKQFIVYKHTTPSGKVYIGITSQTPSKRWLSGHGYTHNDYFYKAIQKYGWENITHEILFDSLTKEEACAKEIELITYYKSNQREYGYNISTGGDGVNGYKHNEERKAKMTTMWSKGHIPWNKGKTTPLETRLKQSKRKRGKPSPRKGVKLTQDQIEKHRLLVSKPVSQYTLNGELIQHWESAKVAAKTLNICHSNINSCCRKRLKSAGGFMWKYKEEC